MIELEKMMVTTWGDLSLARSGAFFLLAHQGSQLA